MSGLEQIGEFLSMMYSIVCDATTKYQGTRGKGAKFEDEVSQGVYQIARTLDFNAYPSRYTLKLPTRSDNEHQFDALFTSKNNYYLIECKNTKASAKDYVYYFNSKIDDYVNTNPDYNFKGIFLCAVPIPDSAWRYSIAYGMRLIDPSSPPPEFMIKTIEENSALHTQLNRYLDKLEESHDWLWKDDPGIISTMLSEYRFLVKRWEETLND